MSDTLERASTLPRRTITSCLPVSVPLFVSGNPDKLRLGIQLHGSVENLAAIHTHERGCDQLPLARAQRSNVDLRRSHC
jgi:hypothetical protein